MAYIGNDPQNQGFTPAIDYFNGNGVTVTFTLSRPVASVAQLIVAIDNVIQNPSSSFTVAGNAITFSSAPLSGTNNIWVEYTSLITTYQAISQDPTVIGDIRATGGYLAEGDFGNSFVDGAILDYVTGLGRITVGDADGLAIYNGGTAARTALMTVAATGNVGIGTSSPANIVELKSATPIQIFNQTTANSNQGIQFQLNGTTYGRMFFNSQTGQFDIRSGLNNGDGYYLTYSTDGAERMRVTSDGKVCIGITTAQQSAMLSVTSGANNTSIALKGDSGTNCGSIRYTSATDGNNYWQLASNQNNFFIFDADASNYAYLAQNPTAWSFASDARIKKDIVDLPYGLDTILAVKPRKFAYISDSKEDIGFIAQELKTVVPEAVSGEEIPFSDDDEPMERASKTMGVSKDTLIPILVKAIQEQQAMIEELKTKVAALEAK